MPASTIRATGEPAPGSRVQALERGLEILSMLVEADGPLTGGVLAGRMGLHESSVSRILATLVRAGYVRRVPGGTVPDFGVLRLVRAARSFPVITVARPVIEEIAAEHPELGVNLCLLFRDELTYLVRSRVGTETVTSHSFPMHQSSAAMRFLVDLPDDRAHAILARSREVYGWQGGPRLPADETAALTWARRHLRRGALVLEGWIGDSVSGATRIADWEGHPLTVAMSGEAGLDHTFLRTELVAAANRVEAALATAGPTTRPTNRTSARTTGKHPHQEESVHAHH
ncbi:helix-turn-helix domain-containing protein [Propionibacteriaceae bacterium Y2011]|uniref:helix-turn-helix domain-containing protein n=1 Tax=Microlunatus sp. Y2014 TaxID=3418488 RepID=UPI003B4B4262